MPHFRVELLGGIRLILGDREITRFRTRKTASLMAFLARFPHIHTRESLIDRFWPEADLDRARHNLSVALTSLRNQLEPAGVPSGSALRADRETVRLLPGAFTSDVGEMLEALSEARKTPHRGEDHLERACRLYHGSFARGFYDDWILEEQDRLLEAYLEAAMELSRRREERGDRIGAVEAVHAALRHDPAREAFHERAIRLYLSMGKRDRALGQYRELERRLADDGETPSPAVRALLAAPEAPVDEPSSGPPIEPVSGSSAASFPFPALHPPDGTVTFLALAGGSDGALPEPLHPSLLSRLQAILRERSGWLIDLEPVLVAVFPSAREALSGAVALDPAPRKREGTIPRMALQTGEVDLHEKDVPRGYRGEAYQAALRLLEAAGPGQLLCSAATAALLEEGLPAGVCLREWGRYRLGHDRSERVVQIHGGGLPDAETPPRADPALEGHLPAATTRFFGREAERQELAALLEGDARLVTLTGPGGSGKTRLALEAAGEMRRARAKIVAFVALAEITDPARIVERVREGLGLPHNPDGETLEQVARALSSQSALVVLDNFEQLVETGSDIVRALLDRVPELTLLVTSRRILGLTGERAFPVDPLRLPEKGDRSGRPPEELLRYESVQLFLDRAQSVRPDFALNERNAAEIEEICRRLEGIPLAVELAAARAGALGIARVLAEMERPLDILVSRKRDVEARHRTLRGTMEWSYRLLSPELRRFFRHLSVFRGGWTAEAAEQVCGDSLALDRITELEEASLVFSREIDGEIRFHMLETLREFARERLSAKEAVEAQHRHADHFRRLCEEADQEMEGPRVFEWLDRLDRDGANIDTALDWAREQDDPVPFIRHLLSLAAYWAMRGYGKDGLVRLLSGEAKGTAVPLSMRAGILTRCGAFAAINRRPASARQYLEDALSLYEGLPDTYEKARCLEGLAGVYITRESAERVNDLRRRLLDLYHRLGDPRSRGLALRVEAHLAAGRGDVDAEQRALEQSLSLFEETGNLHRQECGLNNLGVFFAKRGDYERAREYHEKTLRLRQRFGDELWVSVSLYNLAVVSFLEGRGDEAMERNREVLRIRKRLNDSAGLADSLFLQGQIRLLAGDPRQAGVDLSAALTYYREAGNLEGCCDALSELAAVSIEEGTLDRGRAHLHEALELSRRLGNDACLGYALLLLGKIDYTDGRFEPARRALEEAVICLARIHDIDYISEARELLDRVLREREHDLTRRKEENSLTTG